MPKRERALILSPHKALVHFSQWSLGKWKQPTSALQIDLTAPPLNDSSDAASAMRPATPLTKAMRTRRMSNLAHIADLNLAFERQASFVDRAAEIVKSLPPPQSGPNPAALPPPYVVGPQSRCKHVASIIVLHGPLHEDDRTIGTPPRARPGPGHGCNGAMWPGPWPGPGAHLLSSWRRPHAAVRTVVGWPWL